MTQAALDRLQAALRRLERADRPEVWIHLEDHDALRAQAVEIDRRVAAGEHLPLAGTFIAVKDNIDVAGMPTTAASPGAAYHPERDAYAVRRLRLAGALVLGKTNLDQFATGLVGVRSPYGPVRAAHDPQLVSGGSSSGSAVAVALGIVDAALGTDTAGSGRVPAAFNGIIGVKPTLGLVSARGVVPASPSYDAVTVFSRDLATAERMLAVIAAEDPEDPASRAWPATAPLAGPAIGRIGIPGGSALDAMSPEWRDAFDATVGELRDRGLSIIEVDVEPLLATARLLYGGALVAERTAAFGHLLDAGPETVDRVVKQIVGNGATTLATDLVRDQQTLRAQRCRLRPLWERIDALLLPTAPGHPTIAEVLDNPVGKNAWVGTYTNFVNLLDLAAVAIPGAPPVGVTLVGPAFSDRALLDLAAMIRSEDVADPWLPPGVSLAVFGAHMTGQPLSHQLTRCRARMLRPITTAPRYRFYELPTDPPKPGLVRTDAEGCAIGGEEWLVPVAGLADFLDDLVQPMAIGRVDLSDGRSILGFVCEPVALTAATDISHAGDWRQHLAEPRRGDPRSLGSAWHG
ncbi:allophanate hydrolase [Acrocarpospora pleiomorpha]|uniref:Allophanate hydrolase n=1 Tax=Acrocarpospora pleiomorpha TaxID=90975 RepID=A0A5M3XVJ9_9ACTN|nr:allophanate hydrolase [Acrocarpospora pleiomorpha]GES24930.1 allophanate hydrolase [Acrocarpospora pleiomorpha]